jgi:hypothetical protein
LPKYQIARLILFACDIRRSAAIIKYKFSLMQTFDLKAIVFFFNKQP